MSTLTPTRKKSSNGSGSLLPTLFNDFFNDPFFGGSLSNLPGSLFTGAINQGPSANIEETNNEYIIELSAPGLKREDFKIDLEDGLLTISSEKEDEKSETKKNFRRREFSYSSFNRSFSLPENVLEDKIDARYSDGILHVTIPKKEATIKRPKKEIKIS
jgi:HSP20 family protein